MDLPTAPFFFVICTLHARVHDRQFMRASAVRVVSWRDPAGSLFLSLSLNLSISVSALTSFPVCTLVCTGDAHNNHAAVPTCAHSHLALSVSTTLLHTRGRMAGCQSRQSPYV
jgi:hypothetical protein